MKLSNHVKKVVGLLLAANVVLQIGVMPVLANEGLPVGGGLCEHHQAHTTDCGYIEEKEAFCSYVCTICNPVDSGPAIGLSGTEESEKLCNCGMRCAEGNVDPDCPVCGADGADLGVCKGVQETGEAVKSLQEQIEELPTVDALAAQIPEEGSEDYETAMKEYQDALDAVREKVVAARSAYESLTEDEKQAFDSALLGKLEALEAFLSPKPVLMNKAATTVYLGGSGALDTNDGTESKPVATLKKALELAGKGGTIIVGSTMYISTDTTLTDGVTFLRNPNFTSILFSVYNGAALTLNNVTIDGNGSNVQAEHCLVLVDSGSTLNIQANASIQNNKTETNEIFASGVWVTGSSSLNVTGGSISGNVSGRGGAGVCIDSGSDATLSGGSISGNVSCGEWFRGGGIYVENSAIELCGTAITGNSASMGGGVYLHNSTFIMTSGSVKDNKLTAHYDEFDNYLWTQGGAGITAYGDSSVEIHGGEISGNSNIPEPGPGQEDAIVDVGTVGEAVYLMQGSNYDEGTDTMTWLEVPQLKLKGSPLIRGEVYLDNGGYKEYLCTVHVTETFNPREAIKVNLSVWLDDENRDSVVLLQYEPGVTQRLSDFSFFSNGKPLVLGYNGKGELVSVPPCTVYFGEFNDYDLYGSIEAGQGQLIDKSMVPKPTWTGRELIGWQVRGIATEVWKEWNFDTDPVPEQDTLELVPKWKQLSGKPPAAKKIEIIQYPTKRNYDAYKPLDLTGLEVKVTYDNNTYNTLKWNVFDNNGVTASPKHGQSLTANDTKVILTAGDATVSFDISITSVEVERIEVTKEAQKTEYNAYQPLNLGGLEVSIYYGGGKVETLRQWELLGNGVVTDPAHGHSLDVTDTIVTVTYGGESVSFPITVNPIQQEAPASAPELESRTRTSITLKKVPFNAVNATAVEYSGDGGKTWQMDNVFTNLKSGTEYTFVVRYTASENGNFAPSPPSPEANYSTMGSASSDSGSGSSSSYRDDEYDFWMEVKDRIEDAKPGDTVKANAKSYDRMPASVMEALKNAEGVTLRITWNGGKEIVIPAEAALDEANRIYYPLSYLEGIDFAIKAAPYDPAKENPQTGGVWEVNAPAVADTIITPEITAPQRGLAESPELAEKGVEKAVPGVLNPVAEAVASEPARQSHTGLWITVIAAGMVAAAGGVWFWKRKAAGENK